MLCAINCSLGYLSVSIVYSCTFVHLKSRYIYKLCLRHSLTCSLTWIFQGWLLQVNMKPGQPRILLATPVTGSYGLQATGTNLGILRAISKACLTYSLCTTTSNKMSTHPPSSGIWRALVSVLDARFKHGLQPQEISLSMGRPRRKVSYHWQRRIHFNFSLTLPTPRWGSRTHRRALVQPHAPALGLGSFLLTCVLSLAADNSLSESPLPPPHVNSICLRLARFILPPLLI